jgi:hypothetical protein
MLDRHSHKNPKKAILSCIFRSFLVWSAKIRIVDGPVDRGGSPVFDQATHGIDKTRDFRYITSDVINSYEIV